MPGRSGKKRNQAKLERQPPVPAPARSRAARALPIVVDWHRVLEVRGTVPRWHLEAMADLVKGGFDVTVLSFCQAERARQVRAAVAGLRPHSNPWHLHICPDKTGPRGKAAVCVGKGLARIIDDNQDILQECLEKGLRVYPIQTMHQLHHWARARSIPVYAGLQFAVQAILKERE